MENYLMYGAVPSRAEVMENLMKALTGNPSLFSGDRANPNLVMADVAKLLGSSSELKLTPQFASFGDSRTRQGHSTDNKLIRSFGYQYWAMLDLGSNGVFLPENNFGVSGDTTQMMLDRIGPVLASKSDAVVLLAGTNNWGAGITLEQTIAQFTNIISQIRAAKKLVFVVCELPRGDTAFPSKRLAAQYLAFHTGLRQWLLSQRYTRGVYPVDVYPDFADPISTTGDAQVGLLYDGLHESMYGARLIGKAVAAAIKTVFPQVAQDLAVSNADLYDATNNPYGSLVANPMLDGTAGTKGTGTTGNVATSWGIPALPSGVSCVASKVIDGNKIWQQLVFSGTSAASTVFDIFRQDINAANFAANDAMYATCEIQVDSGSANYNSIGFDNRYTGGFTTQIYGMGDGDPTIPIYNGAWGGYLTTPPNKLPNALPASVRTRFYVAPVAGQPISLTLRIRAVSSRKVRT